MLRQPQGLAPSTPQDTSFKPSPPTICLHAYGTNTTADIPKPVASSPGRERLPWGKKGLAGWGCLWNKFLKKERDKLTTPTKLAREPTFRTKKQKLSQELSLRNIPQRPKQHYLHNSPCKVPTSFICARPFAWS